MVLLDEDILDFALTKSGLQQRRLKMVHAPSIKSDRLETTGAVRDVTSIEDIVAIESEPYDENVAARSIYDLLTATAGLHPEVTTRLLRATASLCNSLIHERAVLFRFLDVGVTRGAACNGQLSRSAIDRFPSHTARPQGQS